MIKRPVLRYHGGKWTLAEWITSHFPAHRIYVEPFGGGASVLLRKPASYAEVYNDLDGEMVNLFRVLRDPVTADRLIEAVSLTPYARDEFVLSYEPSDDPVEQARRTMFRAAAGYSSAGSGEDRTGFRNDSRRTGKTPCGTWAKMPERMGEIVRRMRGVVIENKPAIEVIRIFDDKDTLFYCDPPYVPSTRGARSAGRVYKHEMTDDDHRELARVLHSVQGMVVLSGYPSALYDQELYPDWHRVERPARGDGNAARTEVLWLSTKIQQIGLFSL